MDTFSSRSFFDTHLEVYPVATRLFLGWIENYKSHINWDALIKVDLFELPTEMQMGIIISIIDGKGGYVWPSSVDEENVFEFLSSYLLYIEQKIDSLETGYIHE